MLISRKLDDQSWQDIVAEAEGRLPWLCPAWTDHNAHDPGITIIELMAWYKELQQYRMDRLTPALQRGLLALAGVRPLREQAAGCALEYPPDAPPRRLLSRLGNRQDVCFELVEAIPERRAKLAQLRIRSGETEADALALLESGTKLRPFRFAGREGSVLRFGFSSTGTRTLRLWFDIAQPRGVARNRADSGTATPRTLVWTAEGVGEIRPARDDTLALSWSGFVTLPVPRRWKRGRDGLYWLELREADSGCEERVLLTGISAGRYRAAQQQTRARSYGFRVPAVSSVLVDLESEQAWEAELALFLRDGTGWHQVRDYADRHERRVRTLTLDAFDAVQDGNENLLVVCLDPVRVREMLFDAKGLPGESFFLSAGEGRVLTGSLGLMCLTVLEDGTVRPARWRCVEDLSVCGPRDRVFIYDARRETIVFGDGEHGAVPAAGQGAVLVTGLAVSLCEQGCVPRDAGLCFEEDGMPVSNGPALGGRGPESLAEARGRLLRKLDQTRKCLSAEDYERCARETPGLRVAGAKALPGFSASDPHTRAAAHVSVVVLPAQEGGRPLADARFLEAVSRQLDRRRTICVRTEAIPARYAPFRIACTLRVQSGTDQDRLAGALRKMYAPSEGRIGASARRDDTEALLQALPGVLQVRRLELIALDQSSYRTADGDLQVRADTILSLERVDIEMI